MRRFAGWQIGLFAAVGLGGYAAVLVYVIGRYDLPPVNRWAAILLVASFIAQFAGNWVFGLLFQEGVQLSGSTLSSGAAFRAALVGAGAARLIPAGGAITPVAMAWSVRRQIPGAAAAAVRAAVLNYAGLLVATGLALVWVRGRGLYVALQAGVVTVGVVAAGLGLLVMFGVGWMGSIAARLPAWVARRLGGTLGDFGVGGRAQLLLWARLLLEAAALGLALQAFDIDLTPTQVLAAFGVSQLFGGLPGTPGGLGLTEAGLVGTLLAFGFPAAITVAPVLVYRVVSYWLPAAASLWAGAATFMRSDRAVS